VAAQFQNLNLQHLAVKRIVCFEQLLFFLFQLNLLLAHVDVRLLERGACAVNFGQRVLDGPNRRDSRNVQRDLHELGVRLVEIASVPLDRRHTILNVFEHQVVLRLFDSQRGVHVADNEIVQAFLLFELSSLQTAVGVGAA